MQAGCVFWQNIFTRKIQKHMPLFKNLPITTEAKERYIYGTGNALYQKQLWDYGQEWKKKMQLKVKEPSALQHLSRQKLPSLNLREEFNRSKPNERERKSTQSDDSSALLSREDQNDATLISQSAKNSDSLSLMQRLRKTRLVVLCRPCRIKAMTKMPRLTVMTIFTKIKRKGRNARILAV